MDKFFKRTLVCAAVASVASVGSANAAIDLNGEAVQVYGQAVGTLQLNNPEAADNNSIVEIESRIGFRGVVEFDAFEPKFIWQIEGGNAWNREGNNDAFGAFGGRDTFVGFDFDNVGQIKIGRQLVAAYNYVDWPHSNPGLGNVFDWHNTMKASYQDRANDTIRFDSATWGGWNFQATLSGMDETIDAMVYSLATSFTNDVFSVHAGYYGQGEYDTAAKDAEWGYDKDLCTAGTPGPGNNTCYGPTGGEAAGKDGDVNYTIVGGSLFLGDVTLTGAYKNMQNDLTNNDQDAYSLTGQYIIDGKWVLKAGYAATNDSANAKVDDASTAITARVGYLLPSAYLFMDVRDYDMEGDKNKDDGTNLLLGAEYYF